MPKTSLQTSPKHNWDYSVSNRWAASHPKWARAPQHCWTGPKVSKGSEVSLTWREAGNSTCRRNGHLGLLQLPAMPTAHAASPGELWPSPHSLTAAPAAPKTPLPLPEQGWDRRSAEKQRPKTSLTTVLRAGLRAAGLDQGTWPVMFYCAIWHGMRKQLPLLLPDRGRKDTS